MTSTNAIFNIDKTVELDVELDGTVMVHTIYINHNGKQAQDVLGVTRYNNVVKAVEFLLKDKNAQSANTADGLTVSRGKI